MIHKNIQWVGHRGYPQKFPENSIRGLIAAFDGGADAVEIDVQITKDGIPVVIHDASIDRISDSTGIVSESNYIDLTASSYHEPDRFNQQHYPTRLHSLEEVCTHLANVSKTVFIEIKPAAIEFLGRQPTMDAVVEASKTLQNRCIISYDYTFLSLIQTVHEIKIGWVLTHYNKDTKILAERLKPDVLISDYKKIPQITQLWEDAWDWFIYDIIDPQAAERWRLAGAYYIESWIAPKLAHSFRKAVNTNSS